MDSNISTFFKKISSEFTLLDLAQWQLFMLNILVQFTFIKHLDLDSDNLLNSVEFMLQMQTVLLMHRYHKMTLSVLMLKSVFIFITEGDGGGYFNIKLKWKYC